MSELAGRELAASSNTAKGSFTWSRQDCPSVRGLRVIGGQPMHQTQHHFHHQPNTSVVSATNRHVAYSGRFNRNGTAPLSSPSIVRQINSSSSVLKMRNRETDSAPVASHLTSTTSHHSTKDKFSKYSALPAIQTTKRPPLLRQRTYDVLEPVYVKGPLKGKDAIKLPEIRQVTSSNKKKLTETKKRTTTVSVATTSTTGVTTTTPRHKSPEKRKPTVVAAEPTKRQTTTTKTRGRPQGFRPEQLSKDILPESPTAFWFPI